MGTVSEAALADASTRLSQLLDNPHAGDETTVLEEAHALFVQALTSRTGMPRRFASVARSVFARLASFEMLDQLWAKEEAEPEGYEPDFVLRMPRVRTAEDRRRLLADHAAWSGRLAAEAAADPVTRAPRGGGDKLRLGLLSSDLRNHVAGLFSLPLFRHLDPRVELFCYSPFEGPSDKVRDYMAQVSTYRALPGRDARQIAQAVADDGVDALFDLSGFTHRNLVGVLAYKPAPVQASWMGYPHSLGLSQVDHLVTDPFLQGAPDLQVETPLPLPASWVSYYRPMFAVDDPVATADEAAGRPLTFGTMNNPNKYTARAVGLWARIVAAVPGARFLFVRPEAASPTFRRNMTEAFAREGVTADRLAFDPLRGAHMAGYNRIDISLDTFPLTGGTTTCDALWMGVPVVSLTGEAQFERLSWSILNNAGAAALGTQSEADYAARALALAADPAERAELRASLRTRMKAGPLADAPLFARDFYGAVTERLAADPRVGWG